MSEGIPSRLSKCSSYVTDEAREDLGVTSHGHSPRTMQTMFGTQAVGSQKKLTISFSGHQSKRLSRLVVSAWFRSSNILSRSCVVFYFRSTFSSQLEESCPRVQRHLKWPQLGQQASRKRYRPTLQVPLPQCTVPILKGQSGRVHHRSMVSQVYGAMVVPPWIAHRGPTNLREI